MTTTNPLAYAVFPSFNNKTPKEGPRYIPMTFDFTEADTWDVDLMQIQQQGKISTLQAFYVDNSVNTEELTITMGLGGQVIKVQPGYQGYMTALVNNVPKFSVSSPGGVSAIVFALNFPVVNDLWAAAPIASDAEHVIVDNFPDPQNANIAQVGGTNIALGSAASSVSIPVVIANDQGAIAQNLTKVGGGSIVLGQTNSANSLPVTIASDQSTIAISISGNSLALLGFFVVSTATLAVSTTSAAVAVTSNLANIIRVCNIGTEVAFVRVAAGDAVTTDTAILPNTAFSFKGGGNQVAAICSTGTTNLQISVGQGLPQ